MAAPALPLEAVDVEKAFGRKTPFANHRTVVLDRINFRLEPGEILCLLGPSGCGKTTLVNLIMGITVPSSGEVRVMGEKAPFSTTRKRIGFMPQEDALYNDITAADNLRFFGTMYGLSGSELIARMNDMLAFTRLEEHQNKLVAQFSGGMKRRLSLGIALIHNPDLLVLDEPTVGLDPEHRRRIWDEFHTLSKAGKALIVTTHIMDEANRCHRIAMMRDGRIIAQGTPAELLSRTGTTALEEAFLALAADSHNQPSAANNSSASAEEKEVPHA